jgi:alpha-L-fucosidase 2
MRNNLQWKLLAAVIAAVILVAALTAFYFEAQLGSGKQINIRVACVGDSNTSDTQYVYDLGTILGTNYIVENFGVGRTTVSLDFDKPYLNQTANIDAQKFLPNIVVLMLGTNDAFLSSGQRSNFTSDYKTLITQFQALKSNPKIFLVVPPPVFNNTIGLPPTVLGNEVIPLVRQTANELVLPLIDGYTPLVNHPEYFKDGVHLNSQGSEIMATQVFNAIT